jgi:uncharacterized protein GlcG (DUF336 family)
MFKRSKFLILTALLAFVPFSANAAELSTKFALNLEVTKKIAAAAEAYARENDWNVIIAIVDDGGNLLYLQRMDGAQIGSIEIAIRKARSSINFKRPTKAFADRVNSGGTALITLPGAITFDGGHPIVHEGHYLGGIGVSGVTGEQDGFIAKAGADALAGILE